MFGSGQRRSSTSDPEHWLSSSPETGRPESRSKQARKRLWIETTLLSLTERAREVLNCMEAKGKHGEHGVHADHSLRITGGTLVENRIIIIKSGVSPMWTISCKVVSAHIHHYKGAGIK